MAFENNKFIYTPEVDYKSVSEQDSMKIIELLKDFKKGYLSPIETHMTSADTLRQFLNSGSIPHEIRSRMTSKMEEIERELMGIVRIFSQVEARLEQHSIADEASHLYYSIFTGEESNDNKMNFCKMIKIHEHLKHFNEKATEHWQTLRSLFEEIEVGVTGKNAMAQILEYKIYPRIELCEMTDLLIRRMQYILKLPEGYETAHKIKYSDNFTSLLQYNLGTIFQEDLDKIIFFHDNEGDLPPEDVFTDTNTCIANPYFIDTRGKVPFNQSYLYTMTINEKKVKDDTEKIQKAVYLETHLGADSQTLRQDMIRHFISSELKANNMNAYLDFLNNHFQFTLDSIYLHLSQFNDKEKEVFSYHFGPVFFLKLVMQFLKEGQTGYIHRFMGRHNMARELPFEFIKYTLGSWWDINIFKMVTGNERNSKELYDDILNRFTNRWATEQKQLFPKIIYDHLVLRAYHTRDYKALRPFLEKEVSILFYLIYSRFLGTDFLYLPLNKLPKELLTQK